MKTKKKPTLTITQDKLRGWWTVTYPSGLVHNYGSLPTLLGALTDFYSK